MKESIAFRSNFRLTSFPSGVWLEIRPAFQNYYYAIFTPAESRQFSEKILFCAAMVERRRSEPGDSCWSRNDFSWLWLASGPSVGIAFWGRGYLHLVIWRRRRYEIIISLDEALELACQLYFRSDEGGC
jgi:hypothetical protein